MAKDFKAAYRFMRAFTDSARIRIKNKTFIKNRVKNPKNSVMQDPVPDAGLTDAPKLGVCYVKWLVTAVPIGFAFKFAVELK